METHLISSTANADMQVLSAEDMEVLIAGNFVDGLCAGVSASSVAAGVLAATNSWNPAGWVGGTILVADAACAAYGISQL